MPRYRFSKWEDFSTDNVRTVELNANKEITVYYIEVSEMSYKPSASPMGSAKVSRKTALTLNPLDLDIEEGATVTFTGKLSEASGPNQGTGIPGKTIHFLVNNEEKATAITDADGNFSLDYTWTTIGEYEFQVTYIGD